MLQLSHEHNLEELIIKVVLLDIGNIYHLVSVAYAIHMKEFYENMGFLLDKLN